MAIIRASALVAAISGSVGGVNFATGKRGTVARLRGRRIPTQTEVLLRQQAIFANASRTWRELSNEQRSSWRALAPGYPITNRLGQTSPPSGYTLFLEVVIRGLRIWGFQFMDPPAQLPVPILESIASTFEVSGDYTLSFEISTPVFIVRLQVWGARHFSKVIPKTRPRWREIVILPSAGGGSAPVNIRAEWEAVFGTMAIDEAYSLKVVISNAGVEILPPPALQRSAIVLA